MSEAPRMASESDFQPDSVSSQELAELDEETKACIQMQDIERATVGPGKIMVPVKAVATSEDSKRIAITVDHYIDGEVVFHLRKPKTWTNENELVRFLEWYDLSIAGIYQLQTHNVCIEATGTTKGWRLAEPPSYTPPRRERLRARLPEDASLRDKAATVAGSTVIMAAALVSSLIAGLGDPTIPPLLAYTLSGGLVGVVALCLVFGIVIVAEEPERPGRSL